MPTAGENGPITEPKPGGTEILDINSYGGVYGRLLYTISFPKQEVINAINPAFKGDIDSSVITILPDRDYNPITQKLSSDERIAAWKGIQFNEAYKQWRSKLTEAVKLTTDEKKIGAIEAISGKKASEFSTEDADKLYEAFCKGKSDTTAFARFITSNLQANGKTDIARVNALSSGIEWVSGNLFGRQTATVVSRIIELEAEIANNPTGIVQKVFTDRERVNNLTSEETKIFTHLYGGLYAQKIETEPQKDDATPITPEPEQAVKPASEPIPFFQWPKNKRIRALEEVIKDIRNNRPAMDPETDQPVPLTISQDHAVELINKRVRAIKAEPDATPMDEDKIPEGSFHAPEESHEPEPAQAVDTQTEIETAAPIEPATSAQDARGAIDREKFFASVEAEEERPEAQESEVVLPPPLAEETQGTPPSYRTVIPENVARKAFEAEPTQRADKETAHQPEDQSRGIRSSVQRVFARFKHNKPNASQPAEEPDAEMVPDRHEPMPPPAVGQHYENIRTGEDLVVEEILDTKLGPVVRLRGPDGLTTHLNPKDLSTGIFELGAPPSLPHDSEQADKATEQPTNQTK